MQNEMDLAEKNILWVKEIHGKVKGIDASIEWALKNPKSAVPETPMRDVQVLPLKELPEKPGLSKKVGQARLLHDLASIELQAMELGLRTLIEFPEAPENFKFQLIEIIKDEARHLKYCLEGIEGLGFQWGDWPVQVMLWHSVAAEDSLLDRILIVHRYLEGSGLDAGDTILRRLSGVDPRFVRKPVQVIAEEEVGHVLFGSMWYKELCGQEKIDPDKDFPLRLQKFIHRIPRRLEKINYDLRRKAGFSESEIQTLEEMRSSWFIKGSKHHH